MLAGASVLAAYGWLILAILAGMAAAGATAVLVERIAYRPLRNAPRLVPLISAIGVSFFLQDAHPPGRKPDHRPVPPHHPHLWQF